MANGGTMTRQKALEKVLTDQKETKKFARAQTTSAKCNEMMKGAAKLYKQLDEWKEELKKKEEKKGLTYTTDSDVDVCCGVCDKPINDYESEWEIPPSGDSD